MDSQKKKKFIAKEILVFSSTISISSDISLVVLGYNSYYGQRAIDKRENADAIKEELINLIEKTKYISELQCENKLSRTPQ